MLLGSFCLGRVSTHPSEDEITDPDPDAMLTKSLMFEGVEAELDGSPVHAFKTEDYGIPYGYSPVIARNAGSDTSDDVLRKFIAATATGYEYAVRDAREAVAILEPHCRPKRSERFLALSQERINQYYSDGSSKFGRMDPAKWQAWTSWLKDQGLLRKDLDLDDIFTNAFFE